MKMAHRLAIATMCAALAGCASHTTSALAPVPAPNMLQPTAHGSGPQVIQTTSGSYIRACGAQASPLQMRCYALARPALFDGRELIGKSSGFYAPADLQSMYKLPSATRGKKSTVAIVDAYDDPNLESDLAVYRSNYGLPACTTANGCFQKLNQSGQPGPYPSADSSWAFELSVDVDMVSAICPNCHITVIEANDSYLNDLASGVDEAVTLGDHVISTSWGGGEFNGETGYDYYFNNPGYMITVAAGDGAYVAATQYPAVVPWITAVGGTTPVTSKNTRGWSESVWYFPQNNPQQGTGSGCSIYETGRKQSWQHDTGCASRMANDVAAVADSVAGYDTYGASGWYYFFGTSVSSPVVAGVYALAGNAATLNYAEQSYLKPAGMWDIKAGTNGTCTTTYFCKAGPGYDGPTGNGTPHGIAAF